MSGFEIPLLIGGSIVSAAGTLAGGQSSYEAGRQSRDASYQSGEASRRRSYNTATALEESGEAAYTSSRMYADSLRESGRASETLGNMQASSLRDSGRAAYKAGKRAQKSYEFQAAQKEVAADESRATGQRAGFEKQRDTRLALSRLQARAAASGGSADDPSILALAGQISTRGEYSALMDMWTGETRALGLEDMAVSDRMTGAALYEEGLDKQRSYNQQADAAAYEGRQKYLASVREANARLYEGRTRRSSSYTQARLTRESGDDSYAASILEGNSRYTEGVNRRTSSYYSAGSTLLSGFGSTYRNYNSGYGYNNRSSSNSSSWS